MAVWGGLTNSCEKKRGEKERYKHLNAVTKNSKKRQESLLQRSMQRNRGKQQNGKDYKDLFEKIRDIKGTFHAKMITIKDRNDMNLTEMKILKRVGKSTQKHYTKKIFMTKIITMV